ncbi:hypothetical protein GCM10009794_21700 [Rothia terrae]
MSVPSANGAYPAATATALPPLDPEALNKESKKLPVVPPTVEWVKVPCQAYSEVLAVASTIAPASLKTLTALES